jgi:hypothetical protein
VGAIACINTFKQSLSGSAFEALAPCTGDTLSILNFPDNNNAFVEEVISGNSAHKMEVAVFSTRFGDNQYGLRLQHQFNPTMSGADGDPQLLLSREVDVPCYATDTLNVQVNGTASDNANVCLQVYYENIPGIAQRLAPWQQVKPLIMQTNQGYSRTLGIEVTVTPGTAGNYGTSVALNANDDRLQADFDYALLGYTTDQPATCFGIRGPDTGNLRIPMPGHWDSRLTAGWFIAQSIQRNAARIPILSSNNKGSTLLDGVSSANPGATKVSLILAQLQTKLGV